MFERHKQIRTKSPLFFPDDVQISAFEQQREETLREILRLLWPNPLSPHEAIDGSPISAAKFFERFLCRWRFALRFKHYAPVRGSKGHCAVLRASDKRGQRTHFIIGTHAAIKVKSCAKIKPACNGTDAGSRGAPSPPDHAGRTVESVTSLSIVCLKTFSTVAPIFDPSRSMIQHC